MEKILTGHSCICHIFWGIWPSNLAALEMKKNALGFSGAFLIFFKIIRFD